MEFGFGELLLAALGLYMAIEGAALALFPERIRRIMALVQQLPPETLRTIGMVMAVIGLVLVRLASL